MIGEPCKSRKTAKCGSLISLCFLIHFGRWPRGSPCVLQVRPGTLSLSLPPPPHRGRESPTILQEGPEMTSRRSKKQCFRKAPRGPMRRAPVSCSLDLPKLFRVVCRKGVMVGVAAGTLLHRTWRLLFFLRRRRVVPGSREGPPGTRVPHPRGQGLVGGGGIFSTDPARTQPAPVGA